MKATKAKNGGGGGSAVRGIGIKPGASGATSHATASHFGYPTGDDDNDGSNNGNEDDDDDDEQQDEDQEEEKQIPKQQNKKHSTNLASKKSSSFNSSMQSSNSSNSNAPVSSTNTARGKANSMAAASRIQSDEENAGTVISKVFHEEKVLLIDNMKSKEGFFESSGLLVINEDEKDIKGKHDFYILR
jgi:hypothetical protein